ncbi:MAG: asparagine synthase (glutamine-hydrolyzing) [candidate division KSB1 bacterium]|nr:asparagine synthase (glutamine-hydrolyzing) [candidate division KSB1 bacterium]
MCGICGLWNLNNAPVDPALLVRMRDSMAHRGPDGAGCVLLDPQGSTEPALFDNLDTLNPQSTIHNPHFSLGLGHRRLSIIDLETGDQPMSNEDGSIWIVYNGEIYNYRELRRELQTRGHVFRTASDTEVIIHAYEEYGENCPVHFNGIFAFAIWDARKRVLFLARDHFGVKPLYYCLHEDCFYFASELKTILCDPVVPRQLDLDALNLCLTFRHTPSPWTLFKGIHKLSPGCSLNVASQHLQGRRYWADSATIDRAVSEEEWIQCLQVAVEQAVVRQMVSDVPIGVSLSSGVDSNTILALMSQHSSGRVRAFTVGFAGREATSEIEPARQMAARFGADFHQQVVTAEDYDDFMARYLWHLEEPIGNESAPAYYFVAKMARQQGVKVLLNGQGADEAFAGYGRYLPVAYTRWLRLGTVPPLRWILPHLFAGTLLGERYHRFLFALDASSDEDHFLRLYSILTDEMKCRLVQPELLARMDPDLPGRYVREQLAFAPQGTRLERMIYVDLRTSLPDNLLLCEDKMAMAASVEARVPFLDLELMAVAERIPGKFKLRGLRDKYIHRKACVRWVGKGVTSRPQIGFDNAVDLWLRSRLGDHMRRIVTSSDSFTGMYLNPSYVLSLMQEHAEGHRDHQHVLFLLFSLENWYDVFMRHEGQVRTSFDGRGQGEA